MRDAAQPEPVDDAGALVGAMLKRSRSPSVFALLDVLERHLASPDRARIGRGCSTSRECAQLRHDPRLVFHRGDLHRVERTPDGRVSLEMTFLGLVGTSSPLPRYIAAETAREDPRAPARREFLDIFHHRLLSLLYRMCARLDYPRTYVAGGCDPISRFALAVLGRDTFALERHDEAAALRLAPLLPHRADTTRGIVWALELLLADVVGEARFELVEFIGAWARLEPASRARLGVNNSALDGGMVLGDRVYDVGSRFRVRVGLLTSSRFRDLLPGADGLRRLHECVRSLCAPHLEYDVELLLEPGAAPVMRLSSDHARANLLGRDTWLAGPADRGARVTVEPIAK